MKCMLPVLLVCVLVAYCQAVSFIASAVPDDDCIANPPADDPLAMTCFNCVYEPRNLPDIVKPPGSASFNLIIGKFCLWCETCTSTGMSCNKMKMKAKSANDYPCQP